MMVNIEAVSGVATVGILRSDPEFLSCTTGLVIGLYRRGLIPRLPAKAVLLKSLGFFYG